MKYDHKKIEAKWQRQWDKSKLYQAKDFSKKPKFYQLETFPYPSAAGLHVGHPKGYIAEDIHARFMRMNGKEVLYTMGWDAFGLPTENYAIKIGKNPKEVAEANIKNFKRQVKMFGLSYDWDREINTSSPDYYRWTQWLFIQLFKRGLAYRKKAKVNWCPKDQTVLANEQVVGGNCERCGSPVEQREMEQWFLKITDYADRLLNDLKGLDWPAETLKRQEDWIGRSEGATIEFPISNFQFPITVFTTRPDTLFGATYLVIAPEHKWLEQEIQNPKSKIQNREEVEAYIESTRKKTELMRKEDTREKSGVELKGIKAINPATKEEIPVWIADYVLMGYGTGAIMAVPAHDERDWEFAKKYKLSIKQIIAPYFPVIEGEDAIRADKKTVIRETAYAFLKHPKEDKYVCLDWGKFKWHSGIIGGIDDGEEGVKAAAREIREETGYQNIKFIKTIGLKYHSHFYAKHKNENRYAIGQGFLFELVNEERKSIASEELEKHTVVWIEGRKMEEWLNLPNFKYMWQALKADNDCYVGYGKLINSSQFDELDSEQAKDKITDFVGGIKKVQYKLRDWSVSRQRYWGVPIPMIHCLSCGIVPVPDDELPVKLPDLEDYRPKGMPPLASSQKFINVKCPQCKGKAKRDAETLDTFVDSSWYYLRYTDPRNKKSFADAKKLNYWLGCHLPDRSMKCVGGVDLYVIGAEHTVLHLLYSRFITKFLFDEGYLKFNEPFKKIRHVGLILGADGQKMSKSKGNVVNPDELVAEFGADAVRLYEMFMGPFNEGQPWDPKGVIGTERFLGKVWKIGTEKTFQHSQECENVDLERSLNKTIKKVTEDIESMSFNTAISAMMIFINECQQLCGQTQTNRSPSLASASAASRGGQNHAEVKRSEQIPAEIWRKFLLLLAPFAPHIAEELWEKLETRDNPDAHILSLGKKVGTPTLRRRRQETRSIFKEKWPEFDPKMIQDEEFELIIQINGKFRDKVTVPKNINQTEAEKLALTNEKVKNILDSQKPKKIIFVPGRLINFVTE